MSLAAHDSEFRRWSGGVDRRICQTFAASPAEPGELPLGFRKILSRLSNSEIYDFRSLHFFGFGAFDFMELLLFDFDRALRCM